jgi:hypothetical protein
MAATGKLVVLTAFTKADEGALMPAFEPRRAKTEERPKALLDRE